MEHSANIFKSFKRQTIVGIYLNDKSSESCAEIRNNARS